ncbi:MAG: hypothetical protein IPH07_04265 [Deltaproteobacteria bacterium]|nr:hypothetical protein [Deltaproteobacteria bacterium]MBK8720149.1 hypothetical protein [Deltaproteobacteria bacterium]MBP7289042.1 hypothetical protein [Nannocystaceae bacterium]
MTSRRARAWIGGLAALLGCGDAAAPPDAAPAPAVAVDAAAPATVADAPRDALLAEARGAIAVAADGAVLDADLRAQVLASTAPQHAHAKRLLAALARPRDAGAASASTGTAMPSVPPLAPSATGDADVPPVVPPSSTPGAATTDAPGVASTSAAARPAAAASTAAGEGPASRGASSSGPVQLERLGLAKSKAGASLTIVASRGILVGVVSQPEGGLVRLMLDDVSASAKVLSSRPRVAGAAVTDIARSSKGVRVTIALEPGWTLGGVHRTTGGARVDLRAP